MQSMMLKIQILSRDVNTTFTSHAFLNGWKEVIPAQYVIRYQICLLQICSLLIFCYLINWNTACQEPCTLVPLTGLLYKENQGSNPPSHICCNNLSKLTGIQLGLWLFYAPLRFENFSLDIYPCN